MQTGQDSMGKLCPILLCNRWGTFNMGAGITFWKLTCSHTWCPGSPHIAGGWKVGAFLEFLFLCALSLPGSFSIVRLLTCWLRAPKVCVPRMSEPRFQGREIDSDGEAQPYTVRRVGASRAWSLSGSTTCHTYLFSFGQSLTPLLLVPSPFWWCSDYSQVLTFASMFCQ